MIEKERIIKFTKINSTHKYIKENYTKHDDKTIIISDTQTDGVGTKNQVWYTGTENIAISILFKPDCKISQLEGITIEIAKAIQDVIKDLYYIELRIKHPNDLILNDKKIAGILTEINTIGEKINYLIISVGFNVNETYFPKEIEEIATSLKKEYKDCEFDKELIIKNIICKIQRLITTKLK